MSIQSGSFRVLEKKTAFLCYIAYEAFLVLLQHLLRSIAYYLKAPPKQLGIVRVSLSPT